MPEAPDGPKIGHTESNPAESSQTYAAQRGALIDAKPLREFSSDAYGHDDGHMMGPPLLPLFPAPLGRRSLFRR